MMCSTCSRLALVRLGSSCHDSCHDRSVCGWSGLHLDVTKTTVVRLIEAWVDSASLFLKDRPAALRGMELDSLGKSYFLA